MGSGSGRTVDRSRASHWGFARFPVLERDGSWSPASSCRGDTSGSSPELPRTTLRWFHRNLCGFYRTGDGAPDHGSGREAVDGPHDTEYADRLFRTRASAPILARSRTPQKSGSELFCGGSLSRSGRLAAGGGFGGLAAVESVSGGGCSICLLLNLGMARGRSFARTRPKQVADRGTTVIATASGP